MAYSQKAPLAEQDTWNMLLCILEGLKSFRDLNIHHGDVQPGNIFVLDDKRLKLVDSTFLNDNQDGFTRKNNDIEYSAPLSPQAL